MKKQLLFAIVVLFSFFWGGKKASAQNARLWATYYGKTTSYKNLGIVTDAADNVYMTSGDFLVKFNAAGNRVWAVNFNGTAEGLAVDFAGNVYLAGTTTDTLNIASGGFQNTYGGGNSDAFLVKFDAIGNRLWATYYGGESNDFGQCVATDTLGNVFLGGITQSNSGIASKGFQNANGGGTTDMDAFLVKFDASGNRLWGTYYGGSGDDQGYSVSTDHAGNVYLAGTTQSFPGIASGGFLNTYSGPSNGFLVKFNANGTRLWATYYGGLSGDGVATDVSGNVYLTGTTTGYAVMDIASGGFQNTNGGAADVFLVKFNPAGNRLWATYYGGAGDEEDPNVATDATGNVYLAGDTYSSDSIASGGFQNILVGKENQFVAKFNANGIRSCATYYGQSHEESNYVTVDSKGSVYLAGYTRSDTGIAFGGFQNIKSTGIMQAFLVKFSSCFTSLSTDVVSTYTNCNGQCTGTATAAPAGGTAPYFYSWDTTAAGQTTQTASGLCAGTYTVTVTDSIGNVATARVIITISSAKGVTVTALSTNLTFGGSTQLEASGGRTYQWLTETGLSCSACANPIAAPLQTTTYCVLVSDSNNCSDTTCLTLTVKAPCTEFFIPNAFSPDNDGANDVLYVRNECTVQLDFKIYDRWGNMVFEATNAKEGWDGTYNEKTMDPAVFVYYLQATLSSGEPVIRKGIISLMR